MLPDRIQQLVRLFTRLPTVGEKTALRFVLHLAAKDRGVAGLLANALADLDQAVVPCSRCGFLADYTADDDAVLCAICRNTRRDPSMLCVVARIQDLLSVERSAAFRGYYFVLGRLLSPLEGVGADQLPLDELKLRITHSDAPVREVLLATPPSVDGEATALLIAQQLKAIGVTVTRLASGVPHGGDLEFADAVTIGRAITGRRGLD